MGEWLVGLRVATYNVRSFRSGVTAAATVLRAADVDVALLQECGSRRALRRFASALGMRHVSTHRPFTRVRNAVLYTPRWHLIDAQVMNLTHRRGLHRRGFIRALLETGGARLAAVSVHLGLSPGQRQQHARELTDHLSATAEPIVLGVDLNERPDAPAARWIAQRFADAFASAGAGTGETFPASAPSARIDYLFVRDLRVREAWVPDAAVAAQASDHCPVVGELEHAPG